MRALQDLVRPNVWRMSPHKDFHGCLTKGSAINLRSGENPFNAPINRYPWALEQKLQCEMAKVKGVHEEQLHLSRGCDEAIDTLLRVFCIPGKDNIITSSPTCIRYRSIAEINDVECRQIRGENLLSPSAEDLMGCVDGNTKLLLLCSPNNPTGAVVPLPVMETILHDFDGIVVVDETYIEFSRTKSLRCKLADYPRLVVLGSFSKAWASAGLRLGITFAHPEIIQLLYRVTPPCNLSLMQQEYALQLLDRRFQIEKWARLILSERDRLMAAFTLLPFVKRIYPSEANFFLCEMEQAGKVFLYLSERGILVEPLSLIDENVSHLRITVGCESENSALLAALRQYVPR